MSETERRCAACAHSYMEPDGPALLICGLVGGFGKYVRPKILGGRGLEEPPCGAGRPQFLQHPGRRSDGSLSKPVVYYLATRLERADEAKRVHDLLAPHGWTPSYDWTVHGSVQCGSEERITEVARLEADGVAMADVVLVLLPGGRGTHTELGMALAKETPAVLHSFSADAFVRDGRTCAFYYHPGVARVVTPTIEAFVAHLLKVWGV